MSTDRSVSMLPCICFWLLLAGCRTVDEPEAPPLRPPAPATMPAKEVDGTASTQAPIGDRTYKELITVESLNANGDLHPVQRAMIDCHGSQCGFCTPGFVMSLFALYKTNAAPTRVEIDDALAGNLCRCTGYRPIIAAAEAMYELDTGNEDWLRQPFGGPATPDERAQRLRRLQRDRKVPALGS